MKIIEEYNEFLNSIIKINKEQFGYHHKCEIIDSLINNKLSCNLVREGGIFKLYCIFKSDNITCTSILKEFNSKSEARMFCSKFLINYSYKE